MKLYLLKGLGFGDIEDAFEPIGIFSSRALAEQAKQNIVADGDDDIEFRIDVYELNK